MRRPSKAIAPGSIASDMHTYTHQRRLHWSECDPAGIIFFPTTRWMVEGLNEMFFALGVDPTGMVDGLRTGLPVVSLSMKFHGAPTLHKQIDHEIQVERRWQIAGVAPPIPPQGATADGGRRGARVVHPFSGRP